MTSLAEIARTISLYAQPGMKPKALIATVREHHPEASKKEISRGAFYAVILAAESDPHKVSVLHDMALSTRVAGDETPSEKPAKRGAKKAKAPKVSTH